MFVDSPEGVAAHPPASILRSKLCRAVVYVMFILGVRNESPKSSPKKFAKDLL